MSHLVLFLSNRSLPQEAFRNSLEGLGEELDFHNEREGEFLLSKRKLPLLLKKLEEDPSAFGGNTAFLIAPKFDGFSAKLLHEALEFFPNRLKYLSDIILNEMSFGDYSSLPFVSAIFRDLPEEWILSARKYLECGQDALLAADALYIHRNTFSYRLEQFQKRSQIDIRDYHDALLFEIYLQFIEKD